MYSMLYHLCQAYVSPEHATRFESRHRSCLYHIWYYCLVKNGAMSKSNYSTNDVTHNVEFMGPSSTHSSCRARGAFEGSQRQTFSRFICYCTSLFVEVQNLADKSAHSWVGAPLSFRAVISLQYPAKPCAHWNRFLKQSGINVVFGFFERFLIRNCRAR